MRLPRYLTGWVRLELIAPEPETALAALAERGIVFWDIAPVCDCRTEASVSRRDARRAEQTAARMGAEVRRVREHGLPGSLSAMLRRPVLTGGLVLCAGVLLVSRAFVWQVEVRGNETVPAGVIRAVLSERGVDVGRCWLGYSQDLIRNSVLLELPELRWMTVSMEGCRAVVTVREKRIPPETVQEGEYAGIRAVKAGLVTEITALRGTAETEVNSAVLPGETLIGGYASGRFGVQGAVRAMGEVWARTWYEITAAAPVSAEMKTGQEGSRSLYALQIGKKRINFYKDSSICPTECDKIIIRRTMSVSGAFTLPVTVERTVFIPYRTSPEEALELREELESAAMNELSGELETGGEITSAVFTVSRKADILYVTLRAECLEQIGVTEPLTAEELAEIRAKIPNTEE